MNDLILIVDDNPKNVQLLGQTLRQEEYRVAMAMNGHEALTYLKTEELPQLILLDIMMPEMSGYELCEQLKSHQKLRDIPVIFLTAKSETEDLLKGFAVGGVDYVTKPFHSAELLARVNTHVELKRSREEIIRLQGMLPVCSSCHSIRNDEGFWQTVEEYLEQNSSIPLTHSICPTCIKKLYPELAEEILEEQGEQ